MMHVPSWRRILVLAALMIILTSCSRSRPPARVQVGQAAPEIEGTDLEGQPFKLSDYRGKVVLLSFWGKW